MIERVLEHLDALIAADTSNPPRAIGEGHAAVAHCRRALDNAGFDVSVRDLGGGCVNLLGVRGRPRTLVNCHLDTVPAGEGWSHPPFQLTIDGGRAYGRGTCDIKGAGACLLAAAEDTRGDVAILFTTDEEAGPGRCVPAFLHDGGDFEWVVVAEPTGVRAVTAHRGLVTVEARFEGAAGHSSNEGAAGRSAVHAAVAWGVRVLEWASEQRDDQRLNLGVIEGGVKPNVVASSARIRFGLRPAPGLDGRAILDELRALAAPGLATWEERFVAPGLARPAQADALIQSLGVEEAGAVDFWTEASLFAEAGLPAVVLGPGDIEQAHAADEFVTLDELRAAADVYRRLFT